MEDIDSYLSGKMDGGERTAFEANLKNNPELEAELLVRRGLRQLMLEKKVAEVAQARNKITRNNPWPYVLAACVVLLVASLSVFFFVKNEKTPLVHDLPVVPVVPTPSPEEKELLAADTVDADVQKRKEPIAVNGPSTPLSPPLYPSPNVRGSGSENAAWTQLLDKIWYTDYPLQALVLSGKWAETDQLLVKRDFGKAYVRLQRLEKTMADNDTLRYLKGYCLMEMGEGAEALTYYQDLNLRHPEWTDQLEWYRGLGTLLAGERVKALALFKEISSQSNHPYRKESERAVQVLK